MYPAPYYIEGGSGYGVQTGTEDKMKHVIKLVGKVNDLELGFYNPELNCYELSGLLADHDHHWKILEWLDINLSDGFDVRVVKVKEYPKEESLMARSKRKNKEALSKIVSMAFRNTR